MQAYRDMMMRMLRTATLSLTLLLTAGGAVASAAVLDEEQAEQLRSAQELYQQERYDAAAETLRELLEQQPTLGEGHRLLGHVYFEQGQHDQARQALTEALRHGTMTEDALARMVQIDLEAGRQTAALAGLRLLAIVTPNNTEYRLLQADVLARIGDSAEAAAIQTELLEADATDAELWARLANVHLQGDRPTDAAAALEQAHRLGMQRPEAARTLAALWNQQGNLDEALRWHELAIAMAGESADVDEHLQHAELLVALDEIDRAEGVVREVLPAIEEDEDRGRAEALLGWIADARDQADAAADHFAAALDHGLSNARIARAVATHYFNAERFADAARIVQQHTAPETRGHAMQRLLVLSLLSDADAASDERREAVQLYVEHHGMDEDARQWITQLRG